jgi:hypothetical protein
MMHMFLLVLVVLVLSSTTTTQAFSSSSPQQQSSATSSLTQQQITKVPHKILVLGSAGFVGQEVVKQLEELGIPYETTSRSTGLDLTLPDASQLVETKAQGCTAVISTVGSLEGTAQDEIVNAANSEAAEGAAKAGVSRFIAIGNDPKVRAFSKNIPVLQSYTKGKEVSEAKIMELFPNSYTILQPSLIHGGDQFSASPPRIPAQYGQVAEDILGLYPFQAASEALPSILGIALQAPISRSTIAKAAINSALGLVEYGRLENREAIVAAASKRPSKEIFTECLVEESAAELKQQIYDLGDCGNDSKKLALAFELLEKIERCNEGLNPSTDPTLNGRWDFVFDVEADMGTGVVKDILSGNSPIKAVFDLQDLYMEIENNSEVNIFVKTNILSMMPMEVRLRTKIISDASDPSGTTFLEQFQGLELMGRKLPVPEDWQRSRPLEFSYLDETMLIARGNGGEPHYLKRD